MLEWATTVRTLAARGGKAPCVVSVDRPVLPLRDDPPPIDGTHDRRCKGVGKAAVEPCLLASKLMSRWRRNCSGAT